MTKTKSLLEWDEKPIQQEDGFENLGYGLFNRATGKKIATLIPSNNTCAPYFYLTSPYLVGHGWGYASFDGPMASIKDVPSAQAKAIEMLQIMSVNQYNAFHPDSPIQH